MSETDSTETDSEVERVVQTFVEITNEHDHDRLPEIFSENATWRTPAAPGGEVHGPEATREVMHRVTGGFPDFHADPGDVFVEGNEGMMTMRFTGTHENEFMNIPPTGQEIELNGMSKVHVVDGKIQELHDVVNMQSLLEQLGVAEG
jgi:steroid delta-isomerase-like uncharacterized protein